VNPSSFRVETSFKTNGRVRVLNPSDWNRAALVAAVNGFNGKVVTVIGDVGIDRYTVGSVDRISPEAPVPIVWVKEERLKLGLAANVADNLKVLGGVPKMLGVVGRDRSGEDFLALSKEKNIDPSNLVYDDTRKTVLKERIVSDRQQLLRVDYETPGFISSSAENELIENAKKCISQSGAVIVQDYSKGLLSKSLSDKISLIAKSSKCPFLVDPNRRNDLSLYSMAGILKPNRKEAEKLSGISISSQDSLLEAGDTIMKRSPVEHLVLTLGRDGMALFSRSTESVTIIPTIAREVFDVSGAGDTVISVLALTLSTGASLETAAILGNISGGIVVGKFGTATVTQSEVMTFVNELG